MRKLTEPVLDASRDIPRTSGVVLMMLGITFVGAAVAQSAGSSPRGTVPPPESDSGSTAEKHLLVPLPPPSAEDLEANPPVTDPRNMEGTWMGKVVPFGPNPFALPQTIYTEKARQIISQQKQIQHDADAKGQVVLSDSGRCRPGNGIAIGADLFPAEIIQGKDKIVILNEELRGRWVIHMNRGHRNDIEDTYFGDSVGHWEGDTLVVDTTGLRATFGIAGMYSDKARIVSRLRKIDGGQKLELTTTTYDPETYMQPFEGDKSTSYWHPGVQMLEFQCEENMEGAREGMTN